MADLVTRMRLDSSEYDQKVKRAAQNLLDFEAQCRATGQSMNTLSKDNLDYVKSLGQMQTVSKNARGQISELSSAFTELSMQYKRLSDEEKKGDVGKALTASLDQLKTRITDMKSNLADVSKELGDTAASSQVVTGIIDTLGQKFGITANLTDIVTSKTAILTGVIGAMATGVAAATKEWAAYNTELAKQDQQTTVITGMKGDDANNMTDAARSLASVYNVDFRQAIEAANTLMTQFGESGDSAMQILRDGMQGMIMGDGPKLLSMIQQYAPAFHDAGISASQLVAVIQNSEGGIFTDQNMSAIVMGIKNIRLMTKQTSEALAKMGIDGEEMSKKMSDGSMTVFDALKQVASKLKDTEAGSKTAGEVMQTVFGRQGAMAGTNLAEAIETLNTNLEETKTQTGEVGQATAKLQGATENLNKAIRDCFEYDGWDVMKTELQTGLVVALATVVEKLGDAKRYLTELEVAGVNVFDTIRTSSLNALGPLGKVLNLLIDIKNAKSEAAGIASGAGYGGALGQVLNNNKGGGGDGNTPTDDVVPPPNRPSPPHKTSKELDPLQQVQKEIADLSKEALTADEARLEEITKQVAALQEQEKAYKAIQDRVLGIADIDAEIEKLYPQQEVSGGSSQSFGAAMQSNIAADMGFSQQEVDSGNLKTLLEYSIKNGIEGLDIDSETIMEKIFGEGADIPDEYWQSIIDQINEKIEEIGGEIKPLKLNVETGKIELAAKEGEKTAKAWSTAASMISTAGSALQSFENPAAKIAGVIAQAIASVAAAAGQAMAAKDTTSSGYAWIGAAATIAAEMATVISQIHSLTGYAQGGIIKGNSYSGDNLLASVGGEMIGLNAGELVLTKAQTANLANALSGEGQQSGGGSSTPYVTGENIYLGLNNYLRRTGRGEIITSR